MTTQQKPDSKQLDSLVSMAMKKVGAKKENDICRYIPGPKGGYIHHFSMRKLRHEDPAEFASLVNKYIISVNSPNKVAPKPRARRGSRKRRDLLPLTKQDIDRLLFLCRQQPGFKDIARKLSPGDFKTIKKELVLTIKRNEIDQNLWETYAEQVKVQQGVPITVGTPAA